MYGSAVTKPCETMLPSAATNRDGSPVYEVSTCSLVSAPLPCRTSRYAAPEKASTVAPFLPMSATVEKFQAGLSQKKICRFLASQARSAILACSPDLPCCPPLPPLPTTLLPSRHSQPV